MLGKDFDQGSEYFKLEVGKLLPVGQIQPAALFYWNMAIPIYFCTVYGCLWAMWEDRVVVTETHGHMVHKVLAIYYLTFYRKSSLTSNINIIHLFSRSFIYSFIDSFNKHSALIEC